MTLVLGIQYFRNILLNSKLLIYTDSKNITFIKELQSNRYQKWKLILEEYDYEIKHVATKQNICADYFSRNFVIKTWPEYFKDKIIAEISQNQKKSSFNNELNIKKNNLKKIILQRNGDEIEIILDQSNKTFLFPDISHTIIKQFHELLIHPAINKLIMTIREEIMAN